MHFLLTTFDSVSNVMIPLRFETTLIINCNKDKNAREWLLSLSQTNQHTLDLTVVNLQ